MLILVRKPQQAFWIDDEICIRVLDITNERVKVGISAPKRTRVMREELLLDEERAGTISVGDLAD